MLAVLYVASKRNGMFGVYFYHEIDENAVSSGSEQHSLLHCMFTSYPKCALVYSLVQSCRILTAASHLESFTVWTYLSFHV
jgi:hypothetical protein